MGVRLYPNSDDLAVACRLIGVPTETAERYRSTKCPVETWVAEERFDRDAMVAWLLDKATGLTDEERNFMQCPPPSSLADAASYTNHQLVEAAWEVEYALVSRDEDAAVLANFLGEGWGKFDLRLAGDTDDEQCSGETADPVRAAALWRTSTGARYGMPVPDFALCGGVHWC